MPAIRLKFSVVGDGYELLEDFVYYSERYDKYLTIKKGFYSDGATCAIDIKSDAWGVHDHICRYGVWDDGTKITNWQASNVLSDILRSEGRKYRAFYWKWATFLLGGGAARKYCSNLFCEGECHEGRE